MNPADVRDPPKKGSATVVARLGAGNLVVREGRPTTQSGRLGRFGVLNWVRARRREVRPDLQLRDVGPSTRPPTHPCLPPTEGGSVRCGAGKGKRADSASNTAPPRGPFKGACLCSQVFGAPLPYYSSPPASQSPVPELVSDSQKDLLPLSGPALVD